MKTWRSIFQRETIRMPSVRLPLTVTQRRHTIHGFLVCVHSVDGRHKYRPMSNHSSHSGSRLPQPAFSRRESICSQPCQYGVFCAGDTKQRAAASIPHIARFAALPLKTFPRLGQTQRSCSLLIFSIAAGFESLSFSQHRRGNSIPFFYTTCTFCGKKWPLAAKAETELNPFAH